MNGKSRRFSIFIGMAALFAAISIGDAVAQVKTRPRLKPGSRSPRAERVACTIRWAADLLP